jgi:hypothetical protein
MTRRGILHGAAGAGLVTLLAPGRPADAADEKKAAEANRDRECILASGLTEAEADCWELTAKAAGKYFELPELHPMERQEIANAIHTIQYRLLSRPTYRKYKETHKALEEKK